MPKKNKADTGEPEAISEAAARARLRKMCKARGAKAAFARRAGVSRQYISLVVAGDRDMSDRIFKAMGIKRVTFLREVGVARTRKLKAPLPTEPLAEGMS